ncbi:TIGR03086 family protein [Aeromicrobium sp. 636]|uniref:TIGR03086 family protein n=1 Tax=Aeromicrobium senzhongii TaxID=2663859 RepID=A0A8I0K231_9ACTN|nr:MULTISPECIES: TIGR03086 family metal-binding protein [Aeromicrobium]MBC9225669.1 TIGR03086 family protein [Aeromicrobium senzhongii]MCQ3997778.1 TIGR03086 family protein [Aeromicrobium sp. 636]
MDTCELDPACRTLMGIVEDIEDGHLDRPTPCEGVSVGQLLQHVVGLTLAFRAAADKEFGPLTDTSPDAGGWPDLEPGWRDALREQVPQLVKAWCADSAWEGMTRAGGVDLPGAVAGLVALNEVVLHGWDLARATGREYTLDAPTAAACLEFVEEFDPAGTPGMFGPAVPVAEDATVLDRLVARAGRDPHWAPA